MAHPTDRPPRNTITFGTNDDNELIALRELQVKGRTLQKIEDIWKSLFNTNFKDSPLYTGKNIPEATTHDVMALLLLVGEINKKFSGLREYTFNIIQNGKTLGFQPEEIDRFKTFYERNTQFLLDHNIEQEPEKTLQALEQAIQELNELSEQKSNQKLKENIAKLLFQLYTNDGFLRQNDIEQMHPLLERLQNATIDNSGLHQLDGLLRKATEKTSPPQKPVKPKKSTSSPDSQLTPAQKIFGPVLATLHQNHRMRNEEITQRPQAIPPETDPDKSDESAEQLAWGIQVDFDIDRTTGQFVIIDPMGAEITRISGFESCTIQELSNNARLTEIEITNKNAGHTGLIRIHWEGDTTQQDGKAELFIDGVLAELNDLGVDGFEEALRFYRDYCQSGETGERAPETETETYSPVATVALSRANINAHLAGNKSFESIFTVSREKQSQAGNDVLVSRPDLKLFAVFDGVTTRTGSEQVALKCAEILPTQIEAAIPLDLTDAQEIELRLRKVIEYIQAEIRKIGIDGGSTATVTVIRGDRVYCATIGDSPAYLYKPFNDPENRLVRINTDQHIFESVFREYPRLCRFMQDSFDAYNGSPKNLPAVDLPLPDTGYLRKVAAIPKLPPGQKVRIEAIIQTIENNQSNGYIPKKEVPILLDNFYKLGSIITGGIGSIDYTITISSLPYSPSDTLVVDSDGFKGIRSSEQKEILETAIDLDHILLKKAELALQTAENKRFGYTIDDAMSNIFRAQSAEQILNRYIQSYDRLLALPQLKEIAEKSEEYHDMVLLYHTAHTGQKYYEAARILRIITLSLQEVAAQKALPYERVPEEKTEKEPIPEPFSDTIDQRDMDLLSFEDQNFLRQLEYAKRWGTPLAAETLILQKFPKGTPVNLNIDNFFIELLRAANIIIQSPYLEQIFREYEEKIARKFLGTVQKDLAALRFEDRLFLNTLEEAYVNRDNELINTLLEQRFPREQNFEISSIPYTLDENFCTILETINDDHKFERIFEVTRLYRMKNTKYEESEKSVSVVPSELTASAVGQLPAYEALQNIKHTITTEVKHFTKLIQEYRRQQESKKQSTEIPNEIRKLLDKAKELRDKAKTIEDFQEIQKLVTEATQRIQREILFETQEPTQPTPPVSPSPTREWSWIRSRMARIGTAILAAAMAIASPFVPALRKPKEEISQPATTHRVEKQKPKDTEPPLRMPAPPSEKPVIISIGDPIRDASSQKSSPTDAGVDSQKDLGWEINDASVAEPTSNYDLGVDAQNQNPENITSDVNTQDAGTLRDTAAAVPDLPLVEENPLADATFSPDWEPNSAASAPVSFAKGETITPTPVAESAETAKIVDTETPAAEAKADVSDRPEPIIIEKDPRHSQSISRVVIEAIKKANTEIAPITIERAVGKYVIENKLPWTVHEGDAVQHDYSITDGKVIINSIEHTKKADRLKSERVGQTTAVPQQDQTIQDKPAQETQPLEQATDQTIQIGSHSYEVGSTLEYIPLGVGAKQGNYTILGLSKDKKSVLLKNADNPKATQFAVNLKNAESRILSPTTEKYTVDGLRIEKLTENKQHIHFSKASGSGVILAIAHYISNKDYKNNPEKFDLALARANEIVKQAEKNGHIKDIYNPNVEYNDIPNLVIPTDSFILTLGDTDEWEIESAHFARSKQKPVTP